MKDIHLFEVIAQVFAFVGTQYPQRKTDKCPQMDNRIIAAVMLAQFMDLSMTVVTAGDAVVGAGGLDLIVLQLAVLQAFFLETRLEEPASAATAVVVGTVGGHVDEIFFAHHRFDHESEILRNRIAVGFADDLAGVLHGKLDLEVFVPVGVDLQFAFADPPGVVFVNIFDDEVVFEVEFFQSCQD